MKSGCPQCTSPGTIRRQCGEDRARLGVWGDRTLTDCFPIIRNPIGELMKLFAKNRRRNVAELSQASVQI
jgi:hypothetical protein